MAEMENSWHRYNMKKLRHCHPMYTSTMGSSTEDK